MADFCKECSQRFFTEDFEDFADLTSEEETKAGIFAYVLCEGCGGNIFVNHLGWRIDKDTPRDSDSVVQPKE